MNISYSSVFAGFNRQKAATAQHKKAFDAAQNKTDFAREVKDEVNQAMLSGYEFNWENDPKRNLLDSLYDLEEFQDFERVYKFTNPQNAVPLIQKIEQYHSDSLHKLELKKNIYAEKKSALEQSHNDLLNTINQLGRALAPFAR